MFIFRHFSFRHFYSTPRNHLFVLETLLKLFRKDKLLNDNEFYHWIRNYQLNDVDNDDDEQSAIPTVSLFS